MRLDDCGKKVVRTIGAFAGVVPEDQAPPFLPSMSESKPVISLPRSAGQLVLAHGDSVELLVDGRTLLALAIVAGEGVVEGLLWQRVDELPDAIQFADLSTIVTTQNYFSAS